MEIERLIWGQDKPYELFEDATGDRRGDRGASGVWAEPEDGATVRCLECGHFRLRRYVPNAVRGT